MDDRAVNPGTRTAFWGEADVSQFRDGVTLARTDGPEPDTLVIGAPGLQIGVRTGLAAVVEVDGGVAIVAGRPFAGGDAAPASSRQIAEWLVGGESAPAAPGGRYSIVHVDFRGRCVRLLTDRFAVHPLCYAVDGQRIAFADRADAVPPRGESRIDLQSIFNYAYMHVLPAPRTAFVGVHRVEPARCLTYRGNAIEEVATWQPRFASAGPGSVPPTAAEFRALLRSAVEREMDDGPIGAFLSGGTDSSTVVGMLRSASGAQPAVFSIGFDAEGYDEIEYANLAARHFGCQHHVYYVTPDDVIAAVPAIAGQYDQPFGNSSALGAYCCAKLAHERGIRKLLAGDGGDELFGGNVRYAKQKVFAAYERIPAALRSAVLEPLLLGPLRGIPIVRKAASYVAQARVPMPDRTDTYNLLTRHGVGNVFTGRFIESVRQDEPADLQRRIYAATPPAALVDRMLAYDWRLTLADNDLPKVIGTATLAQMRVGFPLLDDRIVDFSLRLSASQKVRRLTLRPWFKQALGDFLPDEILKKKKHGFGLPFGPWLVRHAGLQRFARDAIDGLIGRQLIVPSAMDRLFSAELEKYPGYYGEMIWILMMAEHWLRRAAPRWKLA